MAPFVLSIIVLFSLSSIAYVYTTRGTVRYNSFTEYLQKGWPIFTPFNCLLYIFTYPRARHSVMDASEFPELKALQENWHIIAEEGVALMEQGGFDSISDPESASYYDVGFRTFYKYGWTKFYLSWYGYTHESAKQTCPKTVEILNKIPTVNGAMFTILPAGGQLTRHLDPFASSLRYHLGLQTPNDDACYISVDGQVYSWRDGEVLLFDETYLHLAKNDSDKSRLILMCDIERPMSLLGRIINWPYKKIITAFLVPNTELDKRGFANRTFQTLVPLFEKSKNLKETNLLLYKLLKYTVNTSLLLALFGVVWLIVKFAIFVVS
ncbi:MAG: aspartyl/asparaginyl beta-hydroxylase domain-containing protein [Pseudomonadales bacterium]|nr:aspartyl/asparaginyl beta-hydroxylase domain-containing protein [Pseudomonadales bacterium]